MKENREHRFAAAKEFAEQVLGEPLERRQPIFFGGLQAVHHLWPLVDVFRPVFHRVRSVRYDAAHEEAADEAIRQFAYGAGADEWRELPPAVWRVLLERFTQTMLMALANEHAGNPFTPVPSGFPEDQLLPFLMLSQMTRMSLPFEVQDESALGAVLSQPPASLRRS